MLMNSHPVQFNTHKKIIISYKTLFVRAELEGITLEYKIT